MPNQSVDNHNDIVFDKLSAKERRVYRHLNQKVRRHRFYQAVLLLILVVVFPYLAKMNLLIALCVAVLYLMGLDNLINSQVHGKIERIAFERRHQFKRHTIDLVRKRALREPIILEPGTL